MTFSSITLVVSIYVGHTVNEISTVFFDVQEFKVKQFLSRLLSNYAHHYGLFLFFQFFIIIVYKKPTFFDSFRKNKKNRCIVFRRQHVKGKLMRRLGLDATYFYAELDNKNIAAVEVAAADLFSHFLVNLVKQLCNLLKHHVSHFIKHLIMAIFTLHSRPPLPPLRPSIW